MSCFEVEYRIGPYAGVVTVNASEDDEDSHVIALAKKALLRRCGGVSYLPSVPCYEHWYIRGPVKS